MRVPGSGVERLFVPGGMIEPDEKPAAAAARETREETGFDVDVDVHSELIARYPFVWDGVEHDVTTHFFSASLRGSRAKQGPFLLDDVHLGVVWLSLGRLDAELGFDANILPAVPVQ